MNIDEASVQERCTDAVFERGKNYRDDGRIRRLKRFDDTVTAAVRRLRRVRRYRRVGRRRYRCAVSMSPTRDRASVSTSSRYSWMSFTIRPRTRSSASTRQSDRPTRRPAGVRPETRSLRTRSSANGSSHGSARSVDRSTSTVWRPRRYSNGTLETIPLVTAAIDFSHLFDLAEQYHRTRERYLAAATVYRALFETIDDNAERIDAAHDHYDDLYELLSMATSSVSSPWIPRTRTSRSTPQFSRTESRNTASTRRVFRRGLEALEARR